MEDRNILCKIEIGQRLLQTTQWLHSIEYIVSILLRITKKDDGGCGGLVVECRTPEREVRGLNPTAAV